jgi:biotin carboxyl carrier protein
MKYSIKIDDQTYDVEIEDLRARPIIVLVDGERIEVEPQNVHVPVLSTPVSTHQAPISTLAVAPSAKTVTPTASTSKTVRAPIPGVIVALLVRAGDEVVRGQELCTIEAMKMRNNIRSSRAGRIAEILVDPGQTVNHNDPLMRIEE